MALYVYPQYIIMTKVVPEYQTFIAKVISKGLAIKNTKIQRYHLWAFTGAWLGWN